jgi:hypothetical protein
MKAHGMGRRYVQPYTRMARPIVTVRDYEAVKNVVKRRATLFPDLLDTGRLEALIRELIDYEDRSMGVNASYGIEWALVPRVHEDITPQRRWFDHSG